MNRCSICRTEAERMSVSIAEFRLCAGCLEKLLNADPGRWEYDWYAAHVRRGLAEPLLHAGNVVPIEHYRALRRAAK